MDIKIKTFIEFVRNNCKKNGVKVSLRKVKFVKMTNNIKCAGWFDSTNKELVVAMNHDFWLETLVHEYGHFTQWLEDCKEWKDNINSIVKLDSWLGGKNIRNVKMHIKNARNLELDNEKRSVKIIKDWELDKYIDVNEYTQKANAYVLFYNWMAKTRRWSKPENAPYTNTKIVKMMSKSFDMEYDTLNEQIERAFRDEGI